MEPTHQQLLDAINGLHVRFDSLDNMVKGIGDTLANIIVPDMATRKDIHSLDAKIIALDAKLDHHIADGPRLVW